MRRIRIVNPLIDKTYKTFIGSDYSSGTSITVINNSSFAANDLLIIGEPREELTELKKLNSISGSTTLTLASALNFAHPKTTSVYRVLWDFVSLEYRASGGSFSEITQSAIQWDNKNNETVYYHSDGSNTSEYRFRFYNSVTSTYSEYSPTITGAGFSRNQVGGMIDKIREIIQDVKRKIIQDEEIIRLINRAQDIVYAHNPRYWFLLVDTYKGSNGIAATASTDVYSLATYTTYGHLESLRYKYTSGATSEIYHLEKKSNVEFDKLMSDLNQTADDWAQCYKLLPADSSSDQGYFQVYPKTKNSSIGTFYPNYYDKMADLDTVDDKTQVPLPEILEDFVISQIEKIKGNEGRAKVYEDLFLGPADERKRFEKATGLVLLDSLDKQQKEVQGQPKQLWRFRGQKAVSRLYGGPQHNRDYYKEFYAD